jgi:hypothetical protein
VLYIKPPQCQMPSLAVTLGTPQSYADLRRSKGHPTLGRWIGVANCAGIPTRATPRTHVLCLVADVAGLRKSPVMPTLQQPALNYAQPEYV